ncbi:LysM peptidoglycan-binding domain-containing protein [Leptospira gomenensis]|uniref:LysM peptidoglycan-binding domain-containing protein n=1 Tax=Leptospira gomenensis TaxID=2484974 RepID=A0A5F1YM68_9LEPT|nr:M23 family metallopeptidase [Leptospira gomenensis]TGK32681.1 LysM peptidoglycan-binding domain-containing protein [Leptospira gomenensis]TGK36829.1 LysM peptidoglycan-binding domain-containing protein [Leptospira gomenensis]TGK39904.1 LysM peptidoglycan-binding domain-containing protein [Leptospira gomenensis]TGK58039.1 LysM peptidoglycan-binding domain-containing protein [Leptospira gomenensis]
MDRLLIRIPILLFFFLFPFRIFGAGSQNPSIYSVQKGDTYYSLGKKFGVDYRKIMEWSGKKNGEPLIPGENLKIFKKTKENPAKLSNTNFSKRTQISEGNSDPNRPRLRFPLKTRAPLETPYNRLSFAPHKGILFKATRHNQVRPASAGKVAVIDQMDGYKKYVIVEHKDGYSSVYANLKSVSVTEGETVDSEKIIGVLESGKGLYFQLNRGSTAVEPELNIR